MVRRWEDVDQFLHNHDSHSVINTLMSSRRGGNHRSSGGNFHHLGFFSRGWGGLGSGGCGRGSGVFQGSNWSRLINLRGILIHLGGGGGLRLLGFEEVANARRQPTANLRSSLPDVPPLWFLLFLLLKNYKARLIRVENPNPLLLPWVPQAQR